MILIVTAADDEPAGKVEARLRHRGADVLRFDAADFPSRARISVSFRESKPRYVLRTAQRTVRFDTLSAVWYRKPGRCVAAPVIVDAEVRSIVEQDAAEFLASVWDSLDCRCLPGPPSAMTVAQRKASQMGRAKALGFELPATLFTNDPQEFLDLHRECDGRLVSKITSTLALRPRLGSEFSRYTDPVSSRDVAHADAIALCPIILQAYVAKRVEIRVTVVGTQAFAAEIHSQATHRTRVDWRRYDLAATPHRVHALPAEVAARCVALVAESGLCFGTIDLILTPEGRYVFLELNAAGEYGWIEALTGLPISEAIADFLLGETCAQAPTCGHAGTDAPALRSESEEACHA
jgi:hypothetical protein